MRERQFIIFYSFGFGSISQVTSDCGHLAFPSQVNGRELKLAVVQMCTRGEELAQATEEVILTCLEKAENIVFKDMGFE